jgi:hypothetical protein
MKIVFLHSPVNSPGAINQADDTEYFIQIIGFEAAVDIQI